MKRSHYQIVYINCRHQDKSITLAKNRIYAVKFDV